MAQLPVIADYLEAFEPSKGSTLVYVDFSAQEPHVLAEFSQDPKMLTLYGPNAKPHLDIYLYFGAHTELFGKQIRLYYDPDNPTKESLNTAKKACEDIRKVIKIMVLGMGYGMGPRKLKENVNLAGFKLSLAEASQIYNDYWKFFRGVKNFENALLTMYAANKGYIVNGRGRPVAIHPDYTKDIVNRCLAKGTLIRVKNYGYLPIEDIVAGQEVWDGIEWVVTQGAICNGEMATIDFNGIKLTPDHKVWTNEGMQESGRVRVSSIKKETRPRANWAEVWRLGGFITREVAKKLCHICKSKMPSYRNSNKS